jgi:hypothetical protein
MAPCGWRVQFGLADGLPDARFFPMGKVDWFAVALVVVGMLPVMLVAIVLFWR